MPQFEVGDEITTAGNSPDDQPAIGELRPIIHHMGIQLATYQVTAVWPPVVQGALWRIVGRVVSANGDSHSANGTAVASSEEQMGAGPL